MALVHKELSGKIINSVWAFLSEKVRLVLFGVHKDANTLVQILDPARFGGIVISDDAAVSFLSRTRGDAIKCKELHGFQNHFNQRFPAALPIRFGGAPA